MMRSNTPSYSVSVLILFATQMLPGLKYMWFSTFSKVVDEQGQVTDKQKEQSSKLGTLRTTNVLLSSFALLLAFLSDGVEHLQILTPGLGKLVGLVSLACIMIAILLTHTLLGKQHSKSWQLWQPFIGGWRFVMMQSVSWTLLAISLLVTGLSLHPALLGFDHRFGGFVSTAGLLGFMSEVLMICSIPLYESPVDSSPSIQLRWNDVGTINILLATLSLLLASSLDHLRGLTVYNTQLHSIIAVTCVLCIVNAAAITHLLVGKMRHGAYWRRWNPFFSGGWKFAALQTISWSLFAAALLVGSWSLRFTAVEGNMTLTGALGFFSVLCMVISIQAYTYPVATVVSVTETSPSTLSVFPRWLVAVSSLAESARRFLVIVFFYNLFYFPLAAVLPAVVPFFFTPVWISTSIVCLAGATYATASYLPKPEVSGSRDGSFRRSFIVQDLCNYFKGDIVKTAELDPSSQYIYGYHPHGILPMASMWAHNSSKWTSLFNTAKHSAVTLIASHLFKIPFTRDVLAAAGAREVSRVAFETALKQGKSVFLVPGGMREMQFSFSDIDEITVCTKHKGFIRMALRHGIDLVPVFCFGETKLLDGAFPKLQKWCWKYARMPFPLFYGRWGLPIPRPTPLTVVVGPSIPVKQNDNPTEEEIEAIGKVYFDALRDVFEKNKAAAGHPNSILLFDS